MYITITAQKTGDNYSQSVTDFVVKNNLGKLTSHFYLDKIRYSVIENNVIDKLKPSSFNSSYAFIGEDPASNPNI